MLTLLDLRGGWLFQVRPDLIPEGYLTQTETELWCLYYQDKKRNG